MDCPVAEKLAEPFSFTSKLCEMTSTSITTFSRACVPADSVCYIKWMPQKDKHFRHTKIIYKIDSIYRYKQ